MYYIYLAVGINSKTCTSYYLLICMKYTIQNKYFSFDSELYIFRRIFILVTAIDIIIAKINTSFLLIY